MATVSHLNEAILETVSLGVKPEMLIYRNWVEIILCVNCEPVLGSSAQLVERMQNCVHHGLYCRVQNSKKADKTWTLTSLYNILQVIELLPNMAFLHNCIAIAVSAHDLTLSSLASTVLHFCRMLSIKATCGKHTRGSISLTFVSHILLFETESLDSRKQLWVNHRPGHQPQNNFPT